VKKYSTGSIILHAVQGVGVLFILLTGSLVLSEMPNNVDKISSFAIHMITGVVLLVLTFVRIWFILRSPKVESLNVNGIREKLIKINHLLIYVVILLMGTSGIVMSQLSGLGEIVFFGANQVIDLEGLTPALIHGVLAKVLMFLIVMHVLGVFSYMIKTKENILKRMWL
jgi:cytochrome b561